MERPPYNPRLKALKIATKYRARSGCSVPRHVRKIDPLVIPVLCACCVLHYFRACDGFFCPLRGFVSPVFWCALTRYAMRLTVEVDREQSESHDVGDGLGAVAGEGLVVRDVGRAGGYLGQHLLGPAGE